MEDKDKEELEEKLKKAEDGKDSKEDLKELLNTIEKMANNNKKEVVVIFGILLHHNKLIHLIITMIMNFAITFAILGFFDGLIKYKLWAVIVSIFIFSIYEYIIKILMIRFFPKIVISSVGFIFVIGYILFFAIYDFIINDYQFVSVFTMIGFLLIFLSVRFILSSYIRKSLYNKKKR